MAGGEWLNLCDSRVVVGAFAKGRSSSKSLSHRRRSCLSSLIAGDLQVVNLQWVDTHHDPADYPPRCKEIPPLQQNLNDSLLDSSVLEAVQKRRSPATQAILEHEARVWETDQIFKADAYSTMPAPSFDSNQPEVVENDVRGRPERNQTSLSSHTPKITFREFLVGKPQCSHVFQRKAKFSAATPISFNPERRKNLAMDGIPDPVTFVALKQYAETPGQLWHFGFPSGSFSILQHSSKGTRRRHSPRKGGTLHREFLGNELLIGPSV